MSAMFHRILVAVDGTPAVQSALRTTAELALLTGAKVRVLHIDPSEVVYDTVVGLEDDSAAHRVLDSAVATLRQAGIQADGELLDGLVSDVAAAVQEAAEGFDADLIVLSPHHRTRLAAWFSPSVSDAIAHKSRIAVLLAPGES
ncbi:universal stress protein [Streptomyces sp. NPDC007095]|jgi:nucleotide-binding universal stress UspA family protein|uniref:universal stress protein n=1 Tax=Streptomyces sp. NPDC007095 TaxID=3154482 RepID=UPI00340DAC34